MRGSRPILGCQQVPSRRSVTAPLRSSEFIAALNFSRWQTAELKQAEADLFWGGVVGPLTVAKPDGRAHPLLANSLNTLTGQEAAS